MVFILEFRGGLRCFLYLKGKKRKKMVTEHTKMYSEVYCLLLGLENDIEFLNIPVKEQNFLLKRVSDIKSRLKGFMI